MEDVKDLPVRKKEKEENIKKSTKKKKITVKKRSFKGNILLKI
ncbi:MAG: hypothetical protein CM15mV99_350 [Caudoviricetes sp.]|nr:MAG: hypothetical protein CM15mV99_350 [Caudoviricetes sp.]